MRVTGAGFKSLVSRVPKSADCQITLAVLTPLLTLLMSVLLAWLFVRAALRIEIRWDNPAYHLPFAAMRGGMTTTLLQLNESLEGFFEGFPPLPEFVQGLLWRLSGDIHGTNLANFLAFIVFLIFCSTALEAAFWLVVLLSLAAPLVLIHLSSGYVDLFANVWIAVSFAALAKMSMDGNWKSGKLLSWCVIGFILAAWSKYQMVPLVALIVLTLIGVIYLNGSLVRKERIKLITLLMCAAVPAAAPYVKNWYHYGNPFWPMQVSVFGNDIFPFIVKSQELAARDRPHNLLDASQSEVFFRSLLEIGHPTSYPHRERWIIDQGNATISFRSGGLWASLILVEFLAIAGMSIGLDRRRGSVLVVGILAVVAFVSVLPQSHELRYYMFIALTCAAIAAMLFPSFARNYSRSALALAFIFIGMFVYVLHINKDYLKIERIDYIDMAKFYLADKWWPNLQPGVKYCTVRMGPLPLLLTGPSMNEFQIIDRLSVEHCPAGTTLLQGPY